MKRFKNALAALAAALVFCCAPSAMATPGDFDSVEADALEFVVLFAELKKWYFEDMGGHWQSADFAGFAVDEQESFAVVSEIAERYGLTVPDEYWGCNIVFWDVEELNFYCGLLIFDSSWWDEWEEAVRVGAYFEELGIRELQHALDVTDEQELIDAYTQMLGVAYVHLLKFASILYVHPLDYEAQILDQSVVDAALIEAMGMVSDEFEITPGLNDAWYEPATNGQGFFLTVYPDTATVFMGWFTYDMEFPGQEAIASLGDACQRWLTAQGTYDGSTANLVVYNSSGGLFDTAQPTPALEAIGTVTLEFESCSSGFVSYELPDIGLSGVIPIQRLAADNIAACEARAAYGF